MLNETFWREATFLRWLADRLVYVYGESDNVDFVICLKQIVGRLEDVSRAAVAKENESVCDSGVAVKQTPIHLRIW